MTTLANRVRAPIVVVCVALMGEAAWAQKPVVFRAHKGSCTAVSFSADGKLLASGGEDKLVRLWDVASRSQIREFEGHSIGVNGVAFSPDGKTIASGSPDKSIKFWDVATGKELTTLMHPASVWSVAFSPDGNLLASSGSEGCIRLWDAKKRTETARLDIAEETVLGKEIVSSVAFSPDGKTLVTGPFELGSIRLWDVESRKERTKFGSTFAGALSPDGQLVVIYPSGGEEFILGSVAKRTIAAKLELPQGSQRVFATSFSPDGKRLATSSGARGGGTVRLWEVSPPTVRATYSEAGALALSFSPDSKTLALAGENGEIHLWRLPLARTDD